MGGIPVDAIGKVKKMEQTASHELSAEEQDNQKCMGRETFGLNFLSSHYIHNEAHIAFCIKCVIISVYPKS